MKVEDAWLAGIVEGEGCIDIKHREGKRRPAIRLRVKMNDEDVVARVAAAMGSTYHDGSAGSFETTLTGATAVAVLRRIYPLFGQRRKAKVDELLARTDLSTAA